MNILKSELEALVKELPDQVDVEEVMRRLYLLQKIHAGESAVKSAHTLPHADATARLAKKWQK